MAITLGPRSAGLLRMGIAYRIQEKASGGLSRSIKAQLRRVANSGSGKAPMASRIKPGTRLVRQWNEQTIVVHVIEDGFLYNDQKCGSLSEIAWTVTGARWSGPRFFGLTKVYSNAA